ncbi:hypothetical protein X772_00980 [Mesorhizobium sp. LSJC280B00]|nr:hypothetical protein X772_00980 [Mesorhizobium sp. LSJC280B00]
MFEWRKMIGDGAAAAAPFGDAELARSPVYI